MFRRPISVLLFAFITLLLPTPSAAQKSSGPSSAISTAKSQLAHHDLDAAEHTLWTVISSDPNNQEALMLLGSIRERQQRYAEGEALFRRVLQLDPNSAGAHKNLGSALLAQNKIEEAAENFRAAAVAAPNDYDLKVQLARIYVSNGRFAEVLTTLEDIPARSLPTSAIPVKAAALVQVGRTNDAVALITRVSGSTAATLDLAEVFVTSNQPDLALKTLARIQSKKQPARLYYLEGAAERLKGDAASAKKDFSKALALDPNSVLTLMALAEIAATEKRYADSVNLLQRAHSADPNAIAVTRRLVEQAMNANLHGLVEQTAFELEKKSLAPEDQYLAAAALLQEREYEEAGHIFEGYVAQRSQDSKAFLGLGLAYLNQQRFPEARKALLRALELDPTLTDAEYSLGVLFSKEGDSQSALAHFQRVLQAQPTHAKALLDAGTLYLQQGELEKASSALQASERADPTDPNTQYQLSLLYNRLGNADEARKHMDQFRSLKQNKAGTSQASQ
jgi:superkiller protein 3